MKRPTVQQLKALCEDIFERQIAASPRHQQIKAAFPELLANLVKDVSAHIAMSVDLTIDDMLEDNNG